MARTLTGNATVTLLGILTNTLEDLSTVRDRMYISEQVALATGTGNNQANQIFHDVRTLASGANEALDLAGVLENPFGDVITFSKIKLIYIENRDAVNSLLIGGAASNGFIAPFGDATDKLRVAPSGFLVLTAPLAGYTVTAGTADQLKVEHGAEDGTTADYVVVLMGVAS